MLRRSTGFRAMGCTAVLACAVWLCACTKPELHNFFPAGAEVEQTFGQLYEDGATLKISHYLILNLTPARVYAPSTGTVEFRGNIDGLQNCLLLRPKRYFTTSNNTDQLQALPKPGALTLLFCNLELAALRSDIEARYSQVLSGADAAAARDRFMNNEEGYRSLDVEADAANFLQSTALGEADGGALHLGAYVEEGDPPLRLYVNPMPYLAGAIAPPETLDAVAPSIGNVVFQTSANGTFSDAVGHVPTGDDAGTLPTQRMRVAILSTERTQAGAPVIVPYGFKYELRSVVRSGATVVSSEIKSTGTALLNLFDSGASATIAADMYGSSASAVSDPDADTYYPFLAWSARRPPVDEQEVAYNALAAPASWSLDLTEMIDGQPRFPAGNYELALTALDAVHTPPPVFDRTIRFVLSGSNAPGSSAVTYSPTQGPIGTRLHMRALLRADAFINGNTTVEFTGTFDPDGEDRNGVALPPTSSMTLTFDSAHVTVLDGANLVLRIGAVLPAGLILNAQNLLYARGGMVTGNARVRTPTATPAFDETLPVSFRLTENVRFGQMVEGEFQPLLDIPLLTTSDPNEVAATASFERVLTEWRVEPEPSSPPPSAIQVDVKTLDQDGAALDSRSISLAHVADEDGLAIYRNTGPGSRALVFVTQAAVAGSHGTDLMAVRLAPGGIVRLSGTPP